MMKDMKWKQIDTTYAGKAFQVEAEDINLHGDVNIEGDLKVNGGSISTPTAADVSYDNTASGLTADDVQDAIDEVSLAVKPWALLTTLTTGSENIATGFSEYKIVIKSTFNLSSFVIDPTTMADNNLYAGSYYLSASSHALITVRINNYNASYGSGGGESGGTIYIYAR